MRPAVVVSGSTVGLAVTRSLGAMGVPVVVMHYDEQDTAQHSRYASTSIRIPDPATHESTVIDLLCHRGPAYEGAILIPASDEGLVAVSRHKAKLEGLYTVACPDQEVARRFIEKKLTYELAEACGVPAPRTMVPRSVKDVERQAASIGFPCLVKPSQGHLFEARFRAKMTPVRSIDGAIAAYRRATEAGLEVLLQEIIPGPDGDGANYNSYTWAGRPLVEFTARKLRSSPPRTGSPRVVVSEDIPEIVESGRRILAAMGFEGFSNVEFKRDARDGVFKLMEVNGRHNLSSLLAVRCGLNFPWLQYRHLIEGVEPAGASFERGVYWIDLVRDIGCNLRYSRQEGLTPRDYLRPYLGPHVYAIPDRHDMGPFIAQCRGLASRALHGALPSMKGRRSQSRVPGSRANAARTGRPRYT